MNIDREQIRAILVRLKAKRRKAIKSHRVLGELQENNVASFDEIIKDSDQPNGTVNQGPILCR